MMLMQLRSDDGRPPISAALPSPARATVPARANAALPELVRTGSELDVDVYLCNAMAEQRWGCHGLATAQDCGIVTVRSGVHDSRLAEDAPTGPAIVSEQVCRVDRPDAYLWRNSRLVSPPAAGPAFAVAHVYGVTLFAWLLVSRQRSR